MGAPSPGNTQLENDISAGLASLHLVTSGETVSRFVLYVTELERRNARYGFIKADRSELIRLHLLDALAGLSLFHSLVPVGTVLDFGSGAGFPGLPLAICTPDRPFVLCERKAT